MVNRTPGEARRRLGPLTTADQLVLLCAAATRDGWPIGEDGLPRVPWPVTVGVVGGLLADLAVLGRIAPPGRADIVVADRTPTGDADLDTVSSRLADERRPARWWLGELAADRFDLRRIDGLRPSRLLVDYAHPGENGARYCFAADWGAEGPILDRLRAAINGTRHDERTLALLALLRSCQVHDFWFRAGFGAELADRLDAALREDWVGRAVDDSLRGR